MDDIKIYKSIGAKSKNYDVMDLTTGEMFNFVEGTKRGTRGGGSVVLTNKACVPDKFLD